MLPEKPWTADAILRLAARVLICIFMGTLAGSTLAFLRGPQKDPATGFLGLIAGSLVLLGGALWILGRPWRLETITRNLTVLLICFYGGLALSWWAMRWRADTSAPVISTANVLVAVLSFQGTSLALVHQFLREHRIGWTEAFGFHTNWKRALLLGVMAAILILPLGWGLEFVSALAMKRLHIPAPEQQVVEVLRDSAGWANRCLLGIAVVLVVPVGEELLFRGILYPAIKQWGFPRLAWWGTSLLFGAIHFNLVSLAPLTILALALIWLYENSGNLLAPIIAHMLFNAANFIAVYFADSLDRLTVK